MTIDQFKNFATAATRPNGTGEDTVAHVTGEAQERRVEGRVWQRLGTRTDDFKQKNIAARQAFVDALKVQFGVKRLQDIPRAILEKLEIDDFDLDAEGHVRSDKPLTARRILAVTREVDRIGTLAQRVEIFHSIAHGAITASCRKELVAMALDGSLASAEKLEAFVLRYFGGSVGKQLTKVMVQSGTDHQPLCVAISKDLVAAVHADLVRAGVKRNQLEPVRRALFDLARSMGNGERAIFRELTLSLAAGLDTAAEEIARNSFENRMAIRMEKVSAVRRRDMRGRSTQRIKSERGRDAMLRVALDGLSNFGRLSDANRSFLNDLLLFLARHTGEMGRDRTFIWLRRLNSEVRGGEEGINRQMVRQVLGEVLKGYTDLTDADLKQISTHQLFNFAMSAADESLVNDRRILTEYVRRQVAEAVRQNYTDAETRELMEFAQEAAQAEEPPAAQPEPVAVPPVQDPQRAQAVRENKVVCDNIALLGKLLHRDDVWTLDTKGTRDSVRDTLTNNTELVQSLVQNWNRGETNLRFISTATNLVLSQVFPPAPGEANRNNFMQSIDRINAAIVAFAGAQTDEAKQAACTEIAAQLEALSAGLMQQAQRLLNTNLQQAMSGMGFGGNFKDLPQGTRPEDADLLALAKSRFPVPRNETKPQRLARESKIMAEYAKLVVDPQAGGLGTLLTSLTSNYMARLDVREQRAMISGGLLAITPESLTNMLNGQSVFNLSRRAYPKSLGGEGVEAVLASLRPDDEADGFTAGMKRLLGDVTGGILKGAGPVLQKMVQMLGVQNMPPYLQEAIRACKSDLKPIPADYVQAKLNEIVRRSNGKIRALANPRSIGAASIAQAFICTLTDEAGRTREVVVKMLRPDVRGRMEREIAAIKASVAGAGEGALRTLNARISSLLAELDFTEERANIDACQEIYGQSPYTTLLCVKKAEGCPELPDVLVMEQAPGKTFQRYMDETTTRLDRLLAGHVSTDEHGHYRFSPMQAQDKSQLERELKTMYQDVRRRQANLQRLVEVWFSNAIYGDGKFHGDLHGGNIMVDDTGKLTVIDFGNAPTFSPKDRKRIVQLVVSTMRGKPNGVLDAVKALVSPESQAELERHRGELSAKFAQMFGVGSYGDAQARLTTIFGELARAGVEVPESLYNFIEAFGRLQQLSASMEATLTRISSALPYMRSHEDVAQVDIAQLLGQDGLKLIGADGRETLSLTCDQTIDALLTREIEKLRMDYPGITDPQIFAKLAEAIRNGTYNRLFDSYEETNPVVYSFVELFDRSIADNIVRGKLQKTNRALYDRLDTPEGAQALCDIVLENVRTLFAPYVAMNPALAQSVTELENLFREAWVDHGDGQYLLWVANFQFNARELVFPFERMGGGVPNVMDAEDEDMDPMHLAINGYTTRFKDIVLNGILPGIAQIYKTKMNRLAQDFSLTGFAAPVSLKSSLMGAVLSNVFGTLSLGGLGSVALGLGMAAHSLTDKTIQIRGNFDVDVSVFRAFGGRTEGRVHATKDRRIELVDFKARASVHNAEARRALVESLIAQDHVSAERFYASEKGRKVASLLGLDAGETMDNVEMAPPLTTDLIRRVMAVYDLAAVDRTPASFAAINRLFGNPAAIEDVSYEQVMDKVADAFRTQLAQEDVAATLGVPQEDYETFLRENYGMVLKHMADIGASDPSFACTGNAPSEDQTKRWLMAALVETIADDRRFVDREITLSGVLGQPVTALEQNVRALHLPMRSPEATALLLHGFEADGEALVAFVRGLPDRADGHAIRRQPNAAEQQLDENARRGLLPRVPDDELTPEQEMLKTTVLNFGYGITRLAADDALYQRYIQEGARAEFLEELASRVRTLAYREIVQPPLDAAAETANLLAYWSLRHQIEAPVANPAPEKEAEADAGQGILGMFGNFFKSAAEFLG